MIIKAIGALLVGLLLSIVSMPLVLRLSKKLKIQQTVLSYVDNHALKSGTPTMGGIGFIFSAAVAALIFCDLDRGAIIAISVMIGYGIVGFLDDFIKVKYKRNEGLKPYQKIIFQFLISIIVSCFAFSQNVEIAGIFERTGFSIGWAAIPFFVFVFLAFGNSVNLIDGLDGLAAMVTAIVVFFFAVIFALKCSYAAEEISSFTVVSGGIVGSLIGFLCYNGYPAKIFMGDTGSLALGGVVAAMAVLSGEIFLTALLGIMYVVTALSVIIQVLHYKRTKRRVFLMAPLHHHFERKGIPENRIVVCYAVVSLIIGTGALLITLLCHI